ncbi:hypothetical protein OH77DRAFT_1161162 [Trametes cingulata]|nr:hypothetical protein OH77DRAFT_1161162 [Trametes cingulata]
MDSLTSASMQKHPHSATTWSERHTRPRRLVHPRHIQTRASRPSSAHRFVSRRGEQIERSRTHTHLENRVCVSAFGSPRLSSLGRVYVVPALMARILTYCDRRNTEEQEDIPLSVEPEHRGCQAVRSLKWPGDPNAWLLDSKLSSAAYIGCPGIAEWSLDHRTVTVVFLPNGSTFRHHGTIMEEFCAMLCLSPSELGQPESSSKSFTCMDAGAGRVHPDWPGNLTTMALAAITCESLTADPRFLDETMPSCRAQWQEVIQWWQGTGMRTENHVLAASIVYRPDAWVSCARSADYDTLVQALERDQTTDTNGQLRLSGSCLCFDDCRPLEVLPRRERIQPAVAEELNELSLPSTYCVHMMKALVEVHRDAVDLDRPQAAHERGTLLKAEMRGRLLTYPLGAAAAAITFTLREFLDSESCGALSDATFRAIQKHLHLFEVQESNASKEATAWGVESNALELPLLLIVYQEFGISLDNPTRNQQRLASVSAAHFLSVLGVTDFPVYGLSICGPYGVPSMTWFSSEDKCFYVVDRNTAKHRFDLTTPSGVSRYMAFLSKLEEHGRELRRRVEEAKPGFLERVRMDEGLALRWTARDQLNEYNLWPPEVQEA